MSISQLVDVSVRGQPRRYATRARVDATVNPTIMVLSVTLVGCVSDISCLVSLFVIAMKFYFLSVVIF